MRKEMSRIILSAAVLVAGLVGAVLGRTGSSGLAAQSAECSEGTDVICREVRLCHRKEWRWFWFGSLGLVPLKVCVDSSTEVNYYKDLLGGPGTPSDGDPEADIPDDEGNY